MNYVIKKKNLAKSLYRAKDMLSMLLPNQSCCAFGRMQSFLDAFSSPVLQDPCSMAPGSMRFELCFKKHDCAHWTQTRTTQHIQLVEHLGTKAMDGHITRSSDQWPQEGLIEPVKTNGSMLGACSHISKQTASHAIRSILFGRRTYYLRSYNVMETDDSKVQDCLRR